MYAERRVAAVVPAHNEAKLIGQTITTMPAWMDLIIVVDDASTDDTSAVARATGDARVNVLRHEQNTGVGGAILDGHRRALELGADICVVMAGDAQMDPDYLPALLDPIVDGDREFTKANRFFSRTSLTGMPRSRLIGSIILSFLTKASSGYWHLFDPQNGYTAVTRSALERLDFDRIRRGYSFENSLLINLSIAHVRAGDVPIPARYGEEVSGMRMRKVVPELLRTLWVGFWQRLLYKYVLGSFSPIALLFVVGLLLLGIGLAFGVFAIVYSIGPRSASAGTVLLAVAPALTGVYMLVQALVLDIQESDS